MRSPAEIKEKMSIFRLLKADCRNPEFAMQISQASNAIKIKYNLVPEPRKSSGEEIPVRSFRRRFTTRKLPPQNNFEVDRLLIE